MDSDFMRYWWRTDTREYTVSADDLTGNFLEVTKRPEPNSEMYIWDVNLWTWVIDYDYLRNTLIPKIRIGKELGGFHYLDKLFATGVYERGMMRSDVLLAKEDSTQLFIRKVKGLDANQQLKDEFITLTAEQVITFHTQYCLFVNGCYGREKALVDKIDAGTFVPTDLDQGWPDNQFVAVTE